jgi:hypothetical protein
LFQLPYFYRFWLPDTPALIGQPLKSYIINIKNDLLAALFVSIRTPVGLFDLKSLSKLSITILRLKVKNFNVGYLL